MRPALPRSSRSAVVCGAVAVLGVTVLTACTSTSSPTTSTPPTGNATGPITIGTSLSTTGDFSADGQAFEKGYKLWAKDVNASGGVLGRQVKLDILNDASSADQVITNYQQLFGADHVDVAFGPFSSLLTGPASAVAARYSMAFVEGAGGAPSVFDTPGGTDNAKIIQYLHSDITLNTVQGPVKFDALGENWAAAAFVFQWQQGSFNQVLPLGSPGSVPIIATKPPWSG